MADKTVKSPAAQARYSLRELLGYFLYLGAVGFGGPVALVGYMRRDLVERRNWFTEADYNEGLALSQLSPGPLAGQLAMYLGFVHYGVYGATLTGVIFVLPSFLMVLALGWAYVAFGGLPWMQSVFYGVGAVVIAIIAFSAYRLATRTLKRDPLLWIIFLTLMLATALTGRESVLLILAGGLLAWLVKAPPRRRILPNVQCLFGLAAPGVTGALIGWPIRWGLLGQRCHPGRTSLQEVERGALGPGDHPGGDGRGHRRDRRSRDRAGAAIPGGLAHGSARRAGAGSPVALEGARTASGAGSRAGRPVDPHTGRSTLIDPTQQGGTPCPSDARWPRG
jgi:chromate transport protein ChrA